MSTSLPSVTAWHDEGFAEEPVEKSATGGEVVYRAYGGTSRVLGNCFFVPAIGASLIGYWTADLLERELNAAHWGNTFEGLSKFEMLPGAVFRIGAIAHDNYVGIDDGRRFIQRAYFSSRGIFKQVTFVLSKNRTLVDSVRKTSSFPISAGRYAPEASRRAKQCRQ